MPEGPSAKHTVTMHEGVDDVLRACLTRIEQHQLAIAGGALAETREQLEKQREQLLEQLYGFTRGLVNLLLTNPHDGDLDLWVDGPLSLFFRYASGYHGGFISHGDRQEDPTSGTWSTHT